MANATTGLYYAPGSARAEPVRLSAAAGTLEIASEHWRRQVPIGEIKATSRLARTRRVLTLADGSQVHSDDNDAIDALFPPARLDRLVDRLERHPQAIAASLVFTIAGTVLFFTHGLPWLAERIAYQIPMSAERAIGEQVLAALDETAFGPSELSSDYQARIRARVAEFQYESADRRDYTVEFRSIADQDNAFAIPGGTIIVSDGLVNTLGDDDSVIAVIAHEVGHHESRHVMRSVLQSSAVLVVATLFTGDVSAATGVILAVPTFLLSGHYSREFEREADAFALSHLERNGVSPEWFAHGLTQITAAEEEGAVLGYVSTHPNSAERIAAAVARASAFPSLETVIAERDPRAGETVFDEQTFVGCWEGARSNGVDSRTAWWARFHAGGELEVAFETRYEAEVSDAYYQGRWVVRGTTLATRYKYLESGENAWNVDQLARYTVEHVDQFVMRYRSDDETDFESWRIECEDEVTES